MADTREIGKCRVRGEVGVRLDKRGFCRNCAFKLDSADRRASDIAGIHRDMEEYGVPVNKKRFNKEAEGEYD